MNIGIPALAASGVFLGGTLAAPADMSKGGDGRYVLPVKFGLDGVPLGNEFEVVSDEDAQKLYVALTRHGNSIDPERIDAARGNRLYAHTERRWPLSIPFP